MDVEEKLDWINDNYLDNFDEEPVDSETLTGTIY